MEEKSRLNFKFDKILQLLCSEIYDSPLSMLRENVQNAYDAILMRKHVDPSFTKGLIEISIKDNIVRVSDNGVGMTLDNLKENYWTAGSSGKNNNEARAAGVVGTFGIGAMANFGVCEKLTVISRSYKSEETYTSYVSKQDLATNDECIHYSSEKNQLDHPGTTVIAELEENKIIPPDLAVSYLFPYVRFIPETITLNGKEIGNNNYHLPACKTNELQESGKSATSSGVSFEYRIILTKGSYINPRIELSHITYPPLDYSLGNVIFDTSENTIYGLRNGFGLAPIPIASVFGFGGVADLINLGVTAGRDAISRESVNFVDSLIRDADRLVAEAISQYEIADYSRELHQYIKTNHRYDLASNIKITVANSENRIPLGEISNGSDGKKYMYYAGTDKGIMNSYSDTNTTVLIPSNDRIRRLIQIKVLQKKDIPEISDTPKVTRIFSTDSMTADELSILYRIKTVVEDDYLIPNCEVKYAEISHGLTILAKANCEIVEIFLRKDSPDLETLKTIYKDDYGVFEPFVKDFVRTRLYNRIASYIPSSQKEGAEALYEMLQRKRELYTIEAEDYGSMDHVLKEYLNGRADMTEVLRAVNKEKKQKTQTLSPKSIGNVSEILGHNEMNALSKAPTETCTYDPMPPIMRMEIKTDYKILTTDNGNEIEGYNSFLALWDRMDREFRDFFLQPHTTRVIWSMHKIIYIFTHLSGSLTLYYEMELNKKLQNEETGGKMIKSATIITKNKIFVPIIDELSYYFDIKKGSLKFMVRYDSVKN